MKKFFNAFLKFNEAASAFMLAGIFVTFLIQIFSRYVLMNPVSWTLEVCLTLWVWLIFWCNSFVLEHKDQVTFDILYYGVRPRIRKTFALIAASALIIAMTISFYPTWDFIDFLKIKRSTTLGIPMRNIFIVYLIFMIATIGIYVIRTIRIIRFGLPNEEPHLIPPLNIDDTKEDK